MTLFLSLIGFAIAQLDLNTANVSQLKKLANVEQEDAEKIVNWRAEHGNFSNIEALRVLQLSEVTLDALRQETTINLTVSTSSTRKYTTVEQVLEQFENEPDVRQVQTMAMQYSKTNPELIQRWLRASQRAYALPKVNLQYEKELDQANRYDYISDDNGNPVDELDYTQMENDDKMVVKLEWRLDKLVMSSEQIRVINESSKANKLREDILDEVTRLYFDRRRLQVESLLSPPASLKDKIELALRLQEMTANLDALTGGEFSAAVR